MQFFPHNIIMGPPSKWSFVWIMKIWNQLQDQMLHFRMFANYPCNFCMTFLQKDKTAMLDLEIDYNLHYSHKGSFWGVGHYNIMWEKLHIWANYRGVLVWHPNSSSDMWIMLREGGIVCGHSHWGWQVARAGVQS